MSTAGRLCFIAEWLDPSSQVLWKYQFFYYPDSKEVEVRPRDRGTFCLHSFRADVCELSPSSHSHLPADGGHQEQKALPQKDPTHRRHQARGACASDSLE